MQYREDIDGLRAIAVMSVVLFHIDLPVFTGGFVGVDIFFVISGFLITQQLAKELKAKNFSFLKFYERRARRLFPALFVCLFFVLFVSIPLLSPAHLQELGESLIYAALSLSNVLFYQESGYFDTDSIFKPLLHTWSLGVEEQFYLFWPLLLVLVFRFFYPLSARSPAIILFVVGAVSLWLSESWVSTNPAASFYLPLSRVFQFCAGAILVFVSPPKFVRVKLADLRIVLGLIIIAYSVFFFDESTGFAGINALIPTIGAALILIEGKGKFAGYLLENPISGFIGKISYSLYLYHWPVVVFYFYTRADVSSVEKLSLLVPMFFLAIGSYYFIEQPFRSKGSTFRYRYLNGASFGLVCSLCLLPLLFTASNMWGNKGWSWRFDTEKMSDLYNLEELRQDTFTYYEDNVIGPYFDLADEKYRILVIGDSHGTDVSNAISMGLPSESFDIKRHAFDDDCIYALSDELDMLSPAQQNRCSKQAELLEGSLKVTQADIIIVSEAWSVKTAERVRYLLKRLLKLTSQRKPEIILLGRTPDFFNFQAQAIKLARDGKSKSEINRSAFEKSRRTFHIDELLDSSAKHARVSFLSKIPIVCNESMCDFFDSEGNLTVWDHNHWTLKGAELFGQRLITTLDFSTRASKKRGG